MEKNVYDEFAEKGFKKSSKKWFSFVKMSGYRFEKSVK